MDENQNTTGVLGSHRPTWMRSDGQPGAILTALHKASGSTLAKRRQGDMAWTSIDEVRAVAAAACKEHGIVVVPRMIASRIGGDSKAPLAEATLDLRFVAVEDGTYVTATVTGAGRAGMGRSLTVATTAAVKQALVVVLGIADPEGVADATPAWTPAAASEAAQAWYGRIRAATSLEDLSQAVPDASAHYADEELAHGRGIWREEMDRLRALTVAADTEATVRWKRDRDGRK